MHLNFSLNLLPWREEQHYKNIRRVISLYSFALLLAALLGMLLFQWEQHQQRNLDHQQETFTQQNTQLGKIVTQIAQLRSTLGDNDSLHPLKREFVMLGLQQLSELPFDQGELSTFLMTADQLQFEGEAQSQSEFEMLHQFLNEHYQRVILRQFNPSADQVHFRFEIEEQGESQ